MIENSAAEDKLARRHAQAPAEDEKVSKSARAKADKLRRIKDAALGMFLTKGFDKATTRDIARIADVANGTIFLYAANKRELLFLLYNDEIETAVNNSIARIDRNADLKANLMAVCHAHLGHFATKVDLARFALKHLDMYTANSQGLRFQQIYRKIIARIVELFAEAIAVQELRKDRTANQMATMFFSLLKEELIRFVISEPPNLGESLATLESQIDVLIAGLGAAHAITADTPRERHS
ncbi:TetR/AcrR family transcriptional regulator [Pelagibacterium halotolerans]|uniref:Putative transcriptional regulator, TetR family n=1 Tax=Pelagibacterium halotolerans (strain DSM 22347 / JCM 15775 / CGMCC 1.7692 / B2) TaxID=1082931 RepID=G4R7F5_PELHB|nr:TetR/AcrR family transcriptional regulator [Pelagibacterium halotolerans]AEQ51291.1 putative transcriptional regulator, TetR family [Pelagibacterium halotolerans B2]QJR18852.1 TetR/AcrR family transcriptional regulator [Pelagibacterium halotolerans]SEA66315.1 transcriptional regulator, TetR family [Pelagibacterium halotolerans]